jgi:hypothetical protein
MVSNVRVIEGRVAVQCHATGVTTLVQEGERTNFQAISAVDFKRFVRGLRTAMPLIGAHSEELGIHPRLNMRIDPQTMGIFLRGDLISSSSSPTYEMSIESTEQQVEEQAELPPPPPLPSKE